MIRCPYCKKEAKFVTGIYIYPFQLQHKNKNYYICDPCDAYVGCHKGTRKALGNLANAELRALRIKVHTAFDPFWRSKVMTRKQAYIILATKLKIPLAKCHIADFDINKCKKILEILRCG